MFVKFAKERTGASESVRSRRNGSSNRNIDFICRNRSHVIVARQRAKPSRSDQSSQTLRVRAKGSDE